MKTEKRLFGDTGEELAASYLKNHGYKIIDRNYLVYGGEIDIVALETKKSRKLESNGLKIPKDFLNEDVICFVEVKTRTSDKYGSPAEAVTIEKQNKILHASKIFLEKNKIKNKQIRYDIVEVLDGEISHIKNAF